MTISPVKKIEFLRGLGARRLRGVSLALAQAIVLRVNTTLGIAFASYSRYAADIGRERQVAGRTIPALCRLGLLRKHARRNGPPVLWFPELMDMAPDEAVRRVEWCVRHQGEEPSAYFAGGCIKKDIPSAGSIKNDVSGYIKKDAHNPISNNSSLREEAPQSRRGVEAKRGRRLPEDWQPSPEDRALAKQEGFSDAEIDAMAKDFWRHWTSEAGRKAVKSNWPRVWERWVDKEFGRSKPAHKQGPRAADPRPDPRTFTYGEWRRNCDVMLKNPGSKWPGDYWGPPPGDPNCVMPELLQMELALVMKERGAA